MTSDLMKTRQMLAEHRLKDKELKLEMGLHGAPMVRSVEGGVGLPEEHGGLESALSTPIDRRGFLNGLRSAAMAVQGTGGRGVGGLLVKGLSQVAAPKVETPSGMGLNLSPVEANILNYFKRVYSDYKNQELDDANDLRASNYPSDKDQLESLETDAGLSKDPYLTIIPGENNLYKIHVDAIRRMLHPGQMEEYEGYAGSDDELPEGVKDWDEYNRIVEGLQKKFGHDVDQAREDEYDYGYKEKAENARTANIIGPVITPATKAIQRYMEVTGGPSEELKKAGVIKYDKKTKEIHHSPDLINKLNKASEETSKSIYENKDSYYHKFGDYHKVHINNLLNPDFEW